MKAVYEELTYNGRQALLDAIAADDTSTLGSAIVAAALHEEDFDLVQDACIRLSSHRDEIVRGNAILGFGHLARLFGRLSDEAIGLVRNSLGDESDYVRGQADAAAGDLRHFLGIPFRLRGYQE